MRLHCGFGRRGMTLAAVMAGLITALTACAGVPENSVPERVRTIGGATAAPVPAPSPQPGADPRAIVLGFLQANVSSLPDHNAAKGFLTPEARNTWSDSPVTVVDAYQVRLPDPSTGDVTVTANQVGTRSERHLSDRATGRLRHPAQLRHEASQRTVAYRQAVTRAGHPAVRLPAPIACTRSTSSTSPRKHLVPDPRYSPLLDQSLATWLLDQLLSQPRSELQNGGPTDPGCCEREERDCDRRCRLPAVRGGTSWQQPPRPETAADGSRHRVAFTFSNALMTITDNRRPVSIPDSPDHSAKPTSSQRPVSFMIAPRFT